MHYQVTLERQNMYAVVELQGDSQVVIAAPTMSKLTFPSMPNSFEKSDSLTLYWIGPRRWILRSALNQETELNRLTSESTLPDAVSAVLISDALVFFKITGVDADAIISIASPMDVHPSVFPDNGASYTEMFGLKALVIRCDGGFEVAIERSFAELLLDYFQRAIGISQ